MVRIDYYPVINLEGYTSFAEPHNSLFGKTSTNVPRQYRELPWGDRWWFHDIDLDFPDLNLALHRDAGQEIDEVRDKETWLLWRKRGSTHYEDGFGVTYRD